MGYINRTAGTDPNLEGGRLGLAGTGNLAGVEIHSDTAIFLTSGSGADMTADTIRTGLVVRWVDANNWVMCVRQNFKLTPTAARARLRVYKRVAGVVTLIDSSDESSPLTVRRRMAFAVDADGLWRAWLWGLGATQPVAPRLQGEDSVMATGGALATGRYGVYDACIDATPPTQRYFDNVEAFGSTTDTVMFPGRNLEVRSDRTERESFVGGTFGRVPEYRGGRFYIPTGGDTNPSDWPHVARVMVKARRQNVDEGLSDTLGDAIAVSVQTTPRYLHPIGEEG